MKLPVLALAASIFALPAHADPIAPERVIQVLAEAGAEGLEKTSEKGDIVTVEGKLDGTWFSARLSDCIGNAACQQVMLYAIFKEDGDADLEAYKRVNKFNDVYTFGRAFLIEKEADKHSVGVDYVVQLKDENTFGPTEVETFQSVLDNFNAYMKPTKD